MSTFSSTGLEKAKLPSDYLSRHTVTGGSMFILVDEQEGDRKESTVHTEEFRRVAASQKPCLFFAQPGTPSQSALGSLLQTHYEFNVTFSPSASGAFVYTSIPMRSPASRATAAEAVNRTRVIDALRSLVSQADTIEFEDGMENALTEGIARLVREKGSEVIEALSRLLQNEHMRRSVAAQILMCLGRMEDEPTRWIRSWFLQLCLFSPSRKIRDAAAVGLASLNDPNAVTSLKRAIKAEPIEGLRLDMEQVVRLLEPAT